jgi:hypothetical protein
MSDSIREASLQLVQIYEHYQLGSNFAPCNPQQLDFVNKELDLSASLMAWYSVASPINVDIPTIGNDIPLYGAEDLKAALSGYRYDGNTGLVLEAWDVSWLVIAGEDQYPVVARTANTNNQSIYLATPSKKIWALHPLSTNLEGFLLGIVEYLELFVGYFRRNLNISDEDDNISPEFFAKLKAALTKNPDTRDFSQTWWQWLGYE